MEEIAGGNTCMTLLFLLYAIRRRPQLYGEKVKSKPYKVPLPS